MPRPAVERGHPRAMPIPPFDDIALEPLTTDAAVQSRVHDLIGCALRHQLWLMFLDAGDRQLPLLMPADVPRAPEGSDLSRFAEFLRGLVETVEAASVVITLERAGDDELDDDDRAWFRLIHRAAELAEARLRGPLLAHSTGVRWIAAEDYGS